MMCQEGRYLVTSQGQILLKITHPGHHLSLANLDRSLVRGYWSAWLDLEGEMKRIFGLCIER